jgi:hypothetical protein
MSLLTTMTTSEEATQKSMTSLLGVLAICVLVSGLDNADAVDPIPIRIDVILVGVIVVACIPARYRSPTTHLRAVEQPAEGKRPLPRLVVASQTRQTWGCPDR